MHTATSVTGVLDPVSLWERVDNNRGLLDRLVHLFKDDSANLLRHIAEAIDREDGAQFGRALHTLKGSVGIFAPLHASRTVVELDNLGRKLDFSAARKVHARLVEEIRQLLDALKMLLDQDVR